MTDSATSALLEDDDEETGEHLGGLDDLLASLRSDEEPAPKRGRGRAKKEAPAKDFKAVPTTICEHCEMEVKGNQWTFRQHQQSKRCQGQHRFSD